MDDLLQTSATPPVTEVEELKEMPSLELEVGVVDDIGASGAKNDNNGGNSKLVLLNEELCVGEVFLEEETSGDERNQGTDEGDDEYDLAKSLEPSASSKRSSRYGGGGGGGGAGANLSPRPSRYFLPNKKREVGERGRREKVFECPGELAIIDFEFDDE